MSRRLSLKSEQKTPFEAYLHRHGTCAICRERDTQRHHGANHCAGNFRRQHPACTHDGREPRFRIDTTAIHAIQTGATNV